VFRQVDNFVDSEIDYALPAGFDLTKFHRSFAPWFSGYMDETAYYDCALSAGQVAVQQAGKAQAQAAEAQEGETTLSR
jgi:hypothetical protein